MSIFYWEALDSKGKVQHGTEESDNASLLRRQLRREGLTPLRIREEKKKHTQRSQNLQLGLKKTALIIRQFATLLHAGLPLEQTMHYMIGQNHDGAVETLLRQVHKDINEGKSLAAALGQFPRCFPSFYVAAIAAGEQSGQLPLILNRLADYGEEQHRVRSAIVQAMIYPAILLVVSISITLFLLLKIMPSIVNAFSASGRELPAITQHMLALSHFINQHSLLLGLALLGLIVAIRLLMRYASVQKLWQSFLLKLPVISSMRVSAETARFADTLAVLLSSGVHLKQGLHICRDILQTHALRQVVVRAEELVQEGKSLAYALAQDKRFPELLIQLVASGENSGSLAEMLQKAAEQERSALNMRLSTLLSLLQPLMILFMAVVIFSMVLAILLPILDLNTLIR